MQTRGNEICATAWTWGLQSRLSRDCVVLLFVRTSNLTRHVSLWLCSRLIIWTLDDVTVPYLTDICSWRKETHRNRTDHQTRPCWRPVNTVVCRHTPYSVNAAHRFHRNCHTALGNARSRACHFGRTGPSRTSVDHQRLDTTVRGSCWNRRSDVAARLHAHQLTRIVLNNHHAS